MSKIIDLAGKRFGRWTVIDKCATAKTARRTGVAYAIVGRKKSFSHAICAVEPACPADVTDWTKA
jgi:hypothetical protein